MDRLIEEQRGRYGAFNRVEDPRKCNSKDSLSTLLPGQIWSAHVVEAFVRRSIDQRGGVLASKRSRRRARAFGKRGISGPRMATTTVIRFRIERAGSRSGYRDFSPAALANQAKEKGEGGEGRERKGVAARRNDLYSD